MFKKLLTFLCTALFAVSINAETWQTGAQVAASALQAGDVILLTRAVSRPDAQWLGGYHTMKSTSNQGATTGAGADYSLGLFPSIKNRSAFRLVAGPTMNSQASYYLQEVTTGQYITAPVTTTEKPLIDLTADIANAISFVPTVHDGNSRLIYYDSENTPYYFGPFNGSDYLRFSTSESANDWIFYYAEETSNSFLRSDQVGWDELTDGMEILLQNPTNYNRPASLGEQYLDNVPVSTTIRGYVNALVTDVTPLYMSHGYGESNVWILEKAADASDASHSDYYYLKNKVTNEYIAGDATTRNVFTTATKADALQIGFGAYEAYSYTPNIINAKTVAAKTSENKWFGAAHNYGYAYYGAGDLMDWNLYKITAVTADAKKQESFDRLQDLITTDEATYTGQLTRDYLPSYTAASVTQYQTALAAAKAITMSNTKEEIDAAYATLDSNSPIDEEIQEGGYYYMVSAQNKDANTLAVRIKDGDTQLGWGLLEQNRADYVFKLTKSTNNANYWFLQNFGTDMYIGRAKAWYNDKINVSDTPADNKFQALIGVDGNAVKQPRAYYWNNIYNDGGSFGLTFVPDRFGWHANSDNGATEGLIYNFANTNDAANYNYNRWYMYPVSGEVITRLTAWKDLKTYMNSIETAYNLYILGRTIDNATLVDALETAYTNAQTAVNASTSTAAEYTTLKTNLENAMAALASFVPAGFWQKVRISYADIVDGDLISFEAAAAKGQAGMFLKGDITASNDLYGLKYTNEKWDENAIWEIVATGTTDSQGNNTFYLKQHSTGYYSSNVDRGMRDDITLARKYAFVSPTVGNTKRIPSSNWDDNSVVIQDWEHNQALDCLVGKSFVYLYGAGDSREDNVWNPYRIVWNTNIYDELANAIVEYGSLEAMIGSDPGLYDETTAKAIAYINALAAARAMSGTTAQSDVRTGIDNLKAAYDALLPESVLPITAGWYRLVNAATRADAKVMSAVIDPTVSTTDLRWTILDEKDANQIFYLASSGSDWTIQCTNGYYVSKPEANAGKKIPVSDTAEPQKFYDLGSGRFFWTDSYNYTSCYPSGYITNAFYSFRNDPNLSATTGVMYNWAQKTDPYENNMYVNLWYLRKAGVTEITIGATGYSTYVTDKALVIPDGVTAYGVTGLSSNDLTMTTLTGNVLAANEPVILQGEANKKYYFIETTEAGSGITGNQLQGTGVGAGLDVAANTAYVLYNNGGTAVFRIAAAMTLPAHKAYLPASFVGGSSSGMFNLSDDLTGVAPIVNGQSSMVNEIVDLQGRKVASPKKGQIYIVNGKTVLY